MTSRTPLYSAYADRGARFEVDAGSELPFDFGDASGEAEAAHTTAGIADLSHWGHFTLAGKDGVPFLQGLITNDVKALEPGVGCYAAFLNVHGRIEADCWVFRFEDGLVIQTPPEATEWVARALGRFTRAGDFRFAAVPEGFAMTTLQGPAAPERLGHLLGADLGALTTGSCLAAEFRGEPVRLLGVRRSEEWGVDLLGPSATIEALWRELTGSGEPPVAPIGLGALEILRLEAGVPRFLRDFDSDTVLQEVDVPEIVSFHKGCYLGQEVVARIHFLGQPSKLLRALEIEEGPIPVAGDPVVAGEGDADREVGRVTSSGVSPSRGPVVFAVVKRKHYTPGTVVRVRRGDELVRATVALRTGAREFEKTS